MQSQRPKCAHGVNAVVWQMAVSGLCASLVGIGLSRFAYTRVVPELIAAHWFKPSQAAHLRAANLAGYLAGALLAHTVTSRVSGIAALRTMMLIASAAFFACSAPLSFFWLFLWRFASGVAGGMLMALVAPTVLPHVPPARRGLVGGAIFVGVGCGTIASGTLVPALLCLGLAQTWVGLGSLALVLNVISWNGWPAAEPVARHASTLDAGRRILFGSVALGALHLEYALNAFGLVPHMIFLVDFVSRGLGQGLAAGAQDWVVFGLGALGGPVLAGAIADRLGFRVTLRLAFMVQAAAVSVLPVYTDPVSLTVASLIIGAFVPGIVPLVLGRLRELVAGNAARQKTAWAPWRLPSAKPLAATASPILSHGREVATASFYARCRGTFSVLRDRDRDGGARVSA
jgi:predicted MFS family arabinose efflux permease